MRIEVQYFDGCPNSTEMISLIKEAMRSFDEQIEYEEILVETREKAETVKFRGSPTVLINGIDLENMPESVNTNLSCRYYKNGLPTKEQLIKLIINHLAERDAL